MKCWVFALLSGCFSLLTAQEDFFSVYEKISQVRLWQKEEYLKVVQTIKQLSREELKDTAKVRSLARYARDYMSDTVTKIAKQSINLTFPDINFISSNGKTFSISDFEGKNVVLSYNYFFCDVCISSIDSIVRVIKNDSIQLIALFSEKFSQKNLDLSRFKENVIVGFINEENKDFISLTLGDDFMYYLNKKRQIEYFNKVYGRQNEFTLPTFLRSKE